MGSRKEVHSLGGEPQEEIRRADDSPNWSHSYDHIILGSSEGPPFWVDIRQV